MKNKHGEKEEKRGRNEGGKRREERFKRQLEGEGKIRGKGM